MRRNFRKGAALALIGACLLLAEEAGAASYSTGQVPPAAGFQASGYALQSWTPDMAMAAYQKAYAMNFEIWRPVGLPAGWYATFDGFPVAQVAENRWVYGQVGLDGAIVPTDVLVGSVVPGDVPGLARVAQWGRSRYLDDPEFLKIRNYRCDRMAFLNDPYVKTAIAWNSQRPGVWLWIGTRWKRLEPRSGEYTWQMLKRYRQWLWQQLHENNVWWLGEGEELADIARQWGMLWAGRLAIEGMDSYRDGNGSGSGDESTGSFQASSSEQRDTNGNWDVESVR